MTSFGLLLGLNLRKAPPRGARDVTERGARGQRRAEGKTHRNWVVIDAIDEVGASRGTREDEQGELSSQLGQEAATRAHPVQPA